MSAALRLPPRIYGVVLAGGQARRMGGADKALLPVGGRPMLAHVLERFSPQCAGVVLSANGDPERFAAYGLGVVADPVPGHLGPLAGLLAAFEHAAALEPQVALVASVAADTLFLPRDLVARLAAAREREGADVALAASGGRVHPVAGLWPVALREDLRRALVEEGLRKVERFAARFRVATADWPVDPLDPFFNANTPDDVAAAERLLSSNGGP